MRRVTCRQSSKVVVEQVPWAKKGSTLTYVYQYFLAHWAKKLSWLEVAQSFKSTWYHVCEAVETVVSYGLEHRELTGIKAIGVDEWHRGKGKGSNNYVTLIYQIDQGCRRLLYVGEARCAKTLLKGFRSLGKEVCEGIEFVCSDMWKPYLKVIAKKLPQTLHILDRFHIVANLNKAVNEVRARSFPQAWWRG